MKFQDKENDKAALSKLPQMKHEEEDSDNLQKLVELLTTLASKTPRVNEALEDLELVFARDIKLLNIVQISCILSCFARLGYPCRKFLNRLVYRHDLIRPITDENVSAENIWGKLLWALAMTHVRHREHKNYFKRNKNKQYDFVYSDSLKGFAQKIVDMLPQQQFQSIDISVDVIWAISKLELSVETDRLLSWGDQLASYCNLISCAQIGRVVFGYSKLGVFHDQLFTNLIQSFSSRLRDNSCNQSIVDKNQVVGQEDQFKNVDYKNYDMVLRKAFQKFENTNVRDKKQEKCANNNNKDININSNTNKYNNDNDNNHNNNQKIINNPCSNNSSSFQRLSQPVGKVQRSEADVVLNYSSHNNRQNNIDDDNNNSKFDKGNRNIDKNSDNDNSNGNDNSNENANGNDYNNVNSNNNENENNYDANSDCDDAHDCDYTQSLHFRLNEDQTNKGPGRVVSNDDLLSINSYQLATSLSDSWIRTAINYTQKSIKFDNQQSTRNSQVQSGLSQIQQSQKIKQNHQFLKAEKSNRGGNVRSCIQVIQGLARMNVYNKEFNQLLRQYLDLDLVVREGGKEALIILMWAMANGLEFDDVRWWQEAVEKLNQQQIKKGQISDEILAMLWRMYAVCGAVCGWGSQYVDAHVGHGDHSSTYAGHVKDEIVYKNDQDYFPTNLINSSLLNLALAANRSLQQKTYPGEFQRQVFRTIKQVLQDVYGAIPEQEFQIGGELGFIVDIAIEKYRVLLEVDGQHHFARYPPTRRLGKDTVRDIIMKHLGWKVIRIPYFEWCQFQEEKSRKRYVKELLLQNGVQLNRK